MTIYPATPSPYPPSLTLTGTTKVTSIRLALSYHYTDTINTLHCCVELVSQKLAQRTLGVIPLRVKQRQASMDSRGKKEFVYESGTPLQSSQGSIEGSFRFVPGRFDNPEGEPFEVKVARFPLQQLDYIF